MNDPGGPTLHSPRTSELIHQLRAAQVRLWLDGDRLRYQAPAGALSPELLAEMRACKTELIALLQPATESQDPATATIPRASRADVIPVTVAQQRIWFLYHLDNRGPAYNVPKATRVRGHLDVAALERALRDVVARHEILRTAFVTRDGEPVQVIHPDAEVALRFDDVTALEPDARVEAAQRLTTEEALEPFDLEHAPLLRGRIIRLASDDHVIVLVLHHIVTDGRSLELLFEELSALYDAHLELRPASLAALPVQYADYAAYERQHLRSPRVEDHIAWWTRQLTGGPRMLALPTDRPRPALQTFTGGVEQFGLSPDLTSRLRALGRDTGASLFMGFLATLATLLSRYSGQEEVCVGCPVENRPFGETSRLIGLFVNTLPLRIAVNERATFGELLRQVRDFSLEAFERQDVPLETLVERLATERTPGASPLFQVALSWLDGRKGFATLPGLQSAPFEFAHRCVKFDLDLEVYETNEDLRVSWFYNTALFDTATIRRMIGHFTQLLAAVVASPARPLAELEMLPAAEREVLLGAWSGAGAVGEATGTVPARFERVVAHDPARLALVAEGGTLTYGELNRRADHLAAVLRTHGLRPGMPVGLCAARSVELIVAMVAILKAGGTYVPLDPAHPPERLAALLEDVAAPLVLTHGPGVPRLPPGCTALPIAAAERAGGAAAATPGPGDPAAVAYVMYTSGSTGTPKGVRVPHRAILRLVCEPTYVTLDATETLLQLAPTAFDAATFEIWGALLNGARLVLAPPAAPTLAELGALIRTHGITTLWLTASLFHLMVDERLADLAPLRQLLAGGDVLSVPHVRRAVAALRHGRLINGYGPTENTTFTCCQVVDAATAALPAIPIGRPIGGTTVYVLDPQRRPVPIGVAGELYTGGLGLALDYLRRPDLTAARFVPHPFADGRLYRTGDRVRWRPDGTLEFLGRFDDQLKIRGFRIEPAEVAAAILRLPEVKDAVVSPQTRSTGTELVAWVIPSDAAIAGQPLAELVRQRLRTSVPDFMVPAAVVVLDAFPLTPNGKVDRRALPPADWSTAADVHVAPQTHAEIAVARVMEELLGVDRVGTRDNFFDLGGNSLLATQFVSRCRSSLGVDLRLRQVFETPDVGSLAQAIDTATRAAARLDGAAAITPVNRDEPLPLSFAQERLWFLQRLEPNNPFYNVPIALAIAGNVDAGRLEWCLQEIVRRHEVLRTSYPELDGRPVQRIAADSQISLIRIELDRQLTPDVEIERLARAEARRPFDLENGPVLRASLLGVNERRHVLLLTIHHIAADGWSMGVLVRELTSLYIGGGMPVLPVQYADFACWQRRWIDGEVYHRQGEYWVQQLQAYPAELSLPTDRPRPTVQSFKGRSIRFSVDAGTTARLNALARDSDATLFMVLLAAFGSVLSRYARQHDLIVGCPIANRTRLEIEPLIGFFVNTLALRLDLSGNPTFRELLARCRRTSLDAFANQDFPFDRLVDELQPERDLSRNPLFQVMFALQNAPVDAVDLPDLQVTPLDFERTSAQFDLVLDMWETQGGLLGVLEFSADLFDGETIGRMAGHFCTLLAAAAAAPDTRLAALPLLTGHERRVLLETFNSSRASFPIDCTLHELFERQAASAPGRVAVEHGPARLVYGELNARANRIAHHLRRRGVARNQFVGVFLERGPDFVAAMLGALKAGGAYLPVDPSYPEDRIGYMIADSSARVVLTRRELVTPSLEHAHPGLSWIFIDEQDWSVELDSNPPLVNVPGDRAYMLYTSGSTGLPKGAIIRHDGKVNHIYAQFERLGFHPGTAFLQSAPASADISVWQFLAPLLIGGRTVIVDTETLLDPAALCEAIRAGGVTIIELVPVALDALLECVAASNGDERALPSLECAIVTGESVSPALIRRWLDLFPAVPIVNAYGPTEAADDVAEYTVTTPLPPDARSVPIGTPLANLSLYVLDERLGLTPIGVPGEICVSGIGVGEGYWRDEARTREHFVPNPYGDGGRGSVLYRTGDVGFWRPDGVLECLSRLDDQVKVRGFRIELGDIEAALGRHPSVRQAVVVARDDSQGEKALAAYIVPDPAAPQVAVEIGRICGEQIELWQDLHDGEYRQTLDYGDPTFNVIGWDSNYTGEPLPALDLHEYVDHTVARVLALGPRRILEIGCGTGLIMFPLLPHLDGYVGTDLSRTAIGRLRDLCRSPELRERVPGLDRAVLHQCRADDLGAIPAGSIDTVIFPSVLQYFPDAEYLLAAFDAAVTTLQPDGAIFVGDVRSLPLLDLFHASVALYKSDDVRPIAELLDAIRTASFREQELAIDPAFFFALRERYPAMTDIEVLPKRGRQQNEMTRFRYDVAMRFGGRARPRIAVDWKPWQPEYVSSAVLRRLLISGSEAAVGVRNVPNARLAQELALRRLLHAPQCPGTVGELRTALRRGSQRPGVEPEDLYDLGHEHGFEVHISLASGGRDGSLDVAFVRADAAGAVPAFPASTSSESPAAHTNNPIQERIAHVLEPVLRDHLMQCVPHYMVPASLVVLTRLPTTPAGKIDRRALPPPQRREIAGGEIRLPRTDMETAIAAIWAEVLGLAQCGIAQNFFMLGGHSLKATQVVSRIKRQLGLAVPLKVIFSHPTIEALSAFLEREMPPARPGASEPPPAVPAADHYAVSYGQRRLWVLSQLQEGSIAYNMPASLLLEGRLDVAALERAYHAIIQRHEALRTTFVMIDGEPRQRVLDASAMSLQHVDLAGALDPDAEARDAARLDAARPFDLEHGPLLRASLLRLAADRHVLLFTTHHIVSDDWSLGVLVREVIRAYAGEPLQPLRIQYRDYAAWQNRFLNSAEGQSHGEFWRSRLAGPIPVLDLPGDFPRPPVKTYAGRTVTFTLSPGEAAPLRALVRELESSLFSLLLSAVKVLLYRYTGQTDIVVAAPVAGRDNPDFEDQVGFYINTLALRDTLRPDAPFTETLDRITRNTMEALDHQAYPFDRLINELAVERDASRMPLSDVVVVMQNTGAPDLSLPDVAVRPFIEDVDTSKYDLHFAFEERDLALCASIVYNPDLFRRDRADRMADHLRTLLRSIAADPGRAVADLDILTDEERRRIVSGFNPAPGSMAPARTLVDWFEDVVARVPTRPAVSIDDDNGGRRELTYAELDAAANRLAHMLVARGVGPETFVGLLADRSLEMIVGIVGILKAGGAYVPLDPAYPGERIRFIADDAGAPILLATRGLAGSIGTTAEVIALDGMIEGQSDPGRPACTVRPDHAAYVIYTSGSTGRPKGVIVTHANATRLFSAAASCFEFSHQDVWTVFHSVAFDFSVWEIWGALLSGGRAVIVPQWTARSTDALLDLLDAEAVTVLSQTPSAFAPLIEAESSVEPRRARALRYVVFGGEALDPGILRPWFDRHGDQSPRLVNMYGITETTVHVTYRPLTRADVDSSGSLIGAPLADLKIHLLDSAGRPAPIGVPGEIHVGGAGLARGYSGRPELTAERFLPDPFVPGARLYRSGDLGRYRGDGDIEYLGRADQQVKIRGFRIEPGEIEAALMGHPAVQRALVITRPRAAGIELVAYVVAAAGGDPNLPAALRAFLRTRLPEYMVPAAVVPIPAFPLTPHGKIDRRALPDPDLQRRADEISVNRPLTGMETTVTEVMGALLGKTRVPLNENFFDVGAHSLLLVQAHKAIEGRLGRQFPLIAMYQYPSVGALAAVLDQGTPAPAIDAARAAEAEARAGLRRAAFGARRTGHG